MSRFESLRPLFERLKRVPEVWLAAASALVVAGLSVFAYVPLFGEGMILTGDNLHAWRLFEMHRCIEDGQVPCRWAADLGNGYGLPLFNFYPPLPYYAGDLIHRLGLSYLNNVDALFIIGLAGAGLSMFLLGRALWGNLGGIVCGVAYVYAPYLALDTYMRGALGELWALAVAPALFWAVYRLIVTSRSPYALAIALFSALLLLSHSLMTLIVLPMVAIWAVVLLLTRGRDAWRPALLGGAGALWGLGLAAFFTIPMLAEGDRVQLENTTTFLPGGRLLYESNFVSVRDLFLERSSDYSSLLAGLAGPGTPIQIGWFHWALAGLAIPAAFLLLRAGKHRSALAVPLLGIAFFAGVYMSISASEPIWDTFDALRFMQFPWRYVGLVSLASAALAGVWLAVLRDRPVWLQTGVAVVLVGLFIGGGLTFFEPYHRCTVEQNRPVPCAGSDAEYFGDGPYAASEQGSIHDYLPVAVEQIPPPADVSVFLAGDAGPVMNVDRESDRLAFDVDSSSAAEAQVAIFDYPGWEVRVDGAKTPHTALDPYGTITFDVPPGTHHVDVALTSSTTERVANLISLVSWGAFALAGFILVLSAAVRSVTGRERDV